MTSFREVQVSDQAMRSAGVFGWTGSISDRLVRMAKRSAPITHEKGNRRFDHYVMAIKDGVLLDVYDASLAGEQL